MRAIRKIQAAVRLHCTRSMQQTTIDFLNTTMKVWNDCLRELDMIYFDKRNTPLSGTIGFLSSWFRLSRDDCTFISPMAGSCLLISLVFS